MAAMKPRTGDGPLEVTKEGRARAEREFSWERAAERTVEIYRSLT